MMLGWVGSFNVYLNNVKTVSKSCVKKYKLQEESSKYNFAYLDWSLSNNNNNSSSANFISRFLSIFLKTMRILRFYITVLFKQSPTLKFFSHTISASSGDCNASMQISYFFIVEAPQRKF